MLDDSTLIAAILADRRYYDEAVRVGVTTEVLSDSAQILLDAASEQYARDRSLVSVDKGVLRAQVIRRYGEGSMADSIMGYVESLPSKFSALNVLDEYRLLRRQSVATSLATLLATGHHGEDTAELLAEYRSLTEECGDEDGESYRLGMEDFEGKKGERIPVLPGALNRFLGGGVLRGHNITVYGRPESGKSMFVINLAAGLCAHGYRVLYFANEEPPQDITRRLIARLSNTPLERLRDPAVLRSALKSVDEHYQNFFLLHKSGASAKDVEAVAGRIRPDVIIIDQLRNLAAKDDNRANQLDTVARAVRELGIKTNAATVSVTQAGDSGHNKLILQMNDIDWSNTGIPAAADVMIGIGMDQEYGMQNKRMLNIPKNKVNGKHGSFSVWVDPQRAAFLSKKEA